MDLVELRWPAGLACPGCGSGDVRERPSAPRRTGSKGAVHVLGGWRCRKCAKDFSLTSGTWLDRSRAGVEVWEEFAALVAANDVGVSLVAEWCGVSKPTANQMIRLVGEVFGVTVEEDDGTLLLSLPGVSMAELMGRLLEVRG